LDGAEGEVEDLGADFGVVVEDYEAMVVISENVGVRRDERLWKEEGGAFCFKMTLLLPILSEMRRESRITLIKNQTFQFGLKARPASLG
jgi:hypothetical protein